MQDRLSTSSLSLPNLTRLRDLFYTWRHGRAVDSSPEWAEFSQKYAAGDRS